MESYDINVEIRSSTGKSAIKKLKSEGMIPGIIYNEGEGIPIALEEDELRNIITRQGEDALLNFSIEGKKVSAKIKEIQRDPVNRDIQHVDLIPLDEGTLH